MRYSEFRISRFVLLMAVVALFIGFALHSFAQEDTGTFSGRVVDMDGNPVRDLPVFIASLNSGVGGHYWPVLLPHEFTQLRRAQTDPDGRFSITGIPPDSVYFGALPYNIDERLPNDFEDIVDDFVSRDWTEITENDIEAFVSSNFGMDQGDFEPDIEIVSLRIRRLTFYRRNDQDEIAFGVKPGVHIKNVEVKVQPRMRVRGRILFKDGTSLSKTRVRLHFRAYNVDGTGTRQSGGEPRTDAEGYFIYYLDEKDDPAFYTFSVEYGDLSAETEAVRLEPGERFDGLTLTFDSEPISPELPPQKTEVGEPEPPTKPVSQEVWVVNPENGHAYKRVSCETRDDAIAQSIGEKAYLVAINDAAEQKWLEAVFGYEFYWIGFSDVEDEGQWQWDSGESVTYENWLPNDFFSESLDADERSYAVVTFADGKWYAVGPDSIVWGMTKMAILEKVDLLGNFPVEERR